MVKPADIPKLKIMDTLLSHNANIRTELSILYAKLQVYYLMQIYLWRKRDLKKARLFNARLKQLQESEIVENSEGASLHALCAAYLRMQECYVYELAMVDRILEEYPALFLMDNDSLLAVLEEETEAFSRENAGGTDSN